MWQPHLTAVLASLLATEHVISEGARHAGRHEARHARVGVRAVDHARALLARCLRDDGLAGLSGEGLVSVLNGFLITILCQAIMFENVRKIINRGQGVLYIFPIL